MLLLVCSALFFVSAAHGSGELTILHHPSSLVFKGHDPVRESILKDLYSASLGFSVRHSSNWNGVFIEDPFHLAEAVVTVAVDGVQDIGNAKGHNFPLRTDEDEGEVFTALEKGVLERYPEGSSHLVRVDLSAGLQGAHTYEIFEGVKGEKAKKTVGNQLKLSVEEDRQFLEEVALLNSLVNSVAKRSDLANNAPDVFWFRVGALHPLVDLYGDNSTQVKEAKQLLNDAISRLNNAFNHVYKGRVLVSLVTSDASHTRVSRSLLQSEADEPTNYNVAKNYNKYYPAIFNIILWFGVAMVFSLLAICIALATMDPGRDSIIYRMTSTRLKKDN